MSHKRTINRSPNQQSNRVEKEEVVQNSTLPSAATETFARSEYIDLRKMYIEGEQQAYQTFDNALLTLSSAILGLSVTFVQAFIPTPQFPRLLFLSWVCLIGTLIITLISLLTSQYAFRLQRDILDRVYQGGKMGTNRWDKATAILNILSAIFFGIGIILMVLFGYLNIR